MPAARGVKRTASKSSTATSSAVPKNKKKRGAIQLEIPTLPKNRGCVYTCGQGDVGQLGLGEDVIETTKFKQVTALGDKIVAISAGGMHTIALDSSGKVWTYGCNDEGALGRATNGDKDEASPKRVSLPSQAVCVTAGDSHSAALLDNGDVYAWGAFRDSHGSMGLVVRGREGKPCRDPIKVEIGETAAAIASGSDHLVILTTSGVVFTMGCGEQGQLGRLSQRSASRDARQGFSALLVPSKVTLKAGASAVWAGYHATFVLDHGRERLYAFGLNNYGQLGISGEKRKTALYGPTECDVFRSGGGGWARVAAGQHHTLALHDSGTVYALGRCEYGRLGLGERTTDADVLEPIPKLQDKKCVSIAAGTSNSFAVTDAGEVFSWGMGSEGQLGTGKDEDQTQPAAGLLVPPRADGTPLTHVTQVAAGGQHTVLLAINPNAKHEPSPEPEKETSEQTVDQDPEQEEEGEKERPRSKRQKKEQEEEISSTSGAQAAEVAGDSKPQKVNGDENKPSAMEVDETDTAAKEQKIDDQNEKMETDIQQETKDTKIEISDTSSQGTTDSEMKSQEDSQDSVKSADSDLKDSVKPDSDLKESVKESKTLEENSEVNGTDTGKLETKSVDVIPTSNPLTTTA